MRRVREHRALAGGHIDGQHAKVAGVRDERRVGRARPAGQVAQRRGLLEPDESGTRTGAGEEATS